MATPRTGRPRGRPPKAKAPTLKRRRDRPEKRLADDPNRYWLAIKRPGVQVILYPDQYKSGKLLTPFPAST